MATLREYLNSKIKAKGSTLAAEKAKAKKYKSIAAAKKAGALYYTDKNGKVMAAVYAEDLKKPLAPKKSPRPKARPTEPKVAKTAAQPKITVTLITAPKMFAPKRSDKKEVDAIVKDVKKAIKMPNRQDSDKGLKEFEKLLRKKGNEAALNAHEKAKEGGNPMGIFKAKRKKK